jgi:hypothetical protein
VEDPKTGKKEGGEEERKESGGEVGEGREGEGRVEGKGEDGEEIAVPTIHTWSDNEEVESESGLGTFSKFPKISLKFSEISGINGSS